MADYKLPIITGTSLTAGDLLRWDGSDWVNYPDSNYPGGSDMVTNTSDIVVLKSDILVNASNLTTEISDVQIEVDAISNLVVADQSNIIWMESDIDTNTSDIVVLKSDIAVNASDILLGSASDVATNTSDIVVLKSDILVNASDILLAGGAFGNYTTEDDDGNTIVNGPPYLANQDGFISVKTSIEGAAALDVKLYADTDSDPVSGGDILARLKIATPTVNNILTLSSVPIASGKYFSLRSTGSTTEVIRWYPKSTLVKPTRYVDTNTKLLLHLNGADEAQVTTDSSSSEHPITFVGNAQLDTAQKKFGTASLLLDGTGDFLTAPDHADWDLAANNFTIEFQIRFNVLPDATGVIPIGRWKEGTRGFVIIIMEDGGNRKILFAWSTDGSDVNTDYSDTFSLSANTWYHIALVRNGNTLTYYVDGVAKGTLDMTGITIYDCVDILTIGRHSDADTYYVNGWMDEIRWSNIARWTAPFTAPAFEY